MTSPGGPQTRRSAGVGDFLEGSGVSLPLFVVNSSEDVHASSDITPAANNLDEAEASGGAVIGVGGEGGEGVFSGKEGGSALETSTRAGGEGKSVRDGGENWRKSEITSLDRYENTSYTGTPDKYHNVLCKIWKRVRRNPPKMLKSNKNSPFRPTRSI